MLTKDQKQVIKKIHIFEITSSEKNGIPIKYEEIKKIKRGKEKTYLVEKPLKILNSYQLAEAMFIRILGHGFNKIERVIPKDANCIVRVFQKSHYTHGDLIFNLYGADCFVKDSTKWVSDSDGQKFYLNPKKCLVEFICLDKKIIFDTEFLDIYIKIS